MNNSSQKSLVSNMYIKIFAAIIVGAIIWVIPILLGVKLVAWHMLAIFIATILG